MLGRFVQCQFDLFWVTAQVSIPFLVAGLCLGQLVHDTGQDSEGAVSRELERVTTRGPYEMTHGVVRSRYLATMPR